jgi:hypothetical protein
MALSCRQECFLLRPRFSTYIRALNQSLAIPLSGNPILSFWEEKRPLRKQKQTREDHGWQIPVPDVLYHTRVLPQTGDDRGDVSRRTLGRAPLDGDAVHRIVERVPGQYTNLACRPRTSARMSTATTPRRRAPLPPRPRSHHPLLLGGHPHRSTRHQRRNVSSQRRRKNSWSSRSVRPRHHTLDSNSNRRRLVDEPMAEYPWTPSPEIPTSPRASPSQVVPGTLPAQSRRWRPAKRRHPRARCAIDLAGAPEAIARARATPARPEHAPLATHPPPGHPRTINPRWARRARHLWSECHICLEQRAHSALECSGCRQRPVCCNCVSTLDCSSLNRGRCPVCRHMGELELWYWGHDLLKDPNSPFQGYQSQTALFRATQLLTKRYFLWACKKKRSTPVTHK